MLHCNVLTICFSVDKISQDFVGFSGIQNHFILPKKGVVFGCCLFNFKNQKSNDCKGHMANILNNPRNPMKTER